MGILRLVAAALAAISVCAGAPMTAVAHHSILGFDGTRPVTVRGTVAHVTWGYPHTYVAVDSSDAKGERWVIESESASVLIRLGWTATSIRTGDRVWSVGAGSRDGTRVMRCQFVALSTGTRLPCYPSGTAMMRAGSRSERT